MSKTGIGIRLSGVDVDRANNLASGWAIGRNGWKFEFHVSPGMIDVDMRGQEGSDAKADARQIRRELKKDFSDIFNASK